MVVKQEADGEVLTLTDRWVELDWWMKQSFLNCQTKGCELCNALTASLPHDVKKLPAMDLNRIPLPRWISSSCRQSGIIWSGMTKCHHLRSTANCRLYGEAAKKAFVHKSSCLALFKVFQPWKIIRIYSNDTFELNECEAVSKYLWPWSYLMVSVFTTMTFSALR